MFSSIVRGYQLVCDVYCIPSNNHQTFFFKLYRNEDEYIALYAKTLLIGLLGSHNHMCKFKKCIKAQNNSQVGKIICGTRRISKNDAIIRELMECLPTKNEWHKQVITIDGEYTVIRNHLQEQTKTLSYGSNPNFLENNYSESQKEFLENLYMRVEDIIARSID